MLVRVIVLCHCAAFATALWPIAGKINASRVSEEGDRSNASRSIHPLSGLSRLEKELLRPLSLPPFPSGRLPLDVDSLWGKPSKGKDTSSPARNDSDTLLEKIDTAVRFRDNVVRIFSYLLNGRDGNLTESQRASLRLIHDRLRRKEVPMFAVLPILSKLRSIGKNRQTQIILTALSRHLPPYMQCACNYLANEIQDGAIDLDRLLAPTKSDAFDYLEDIDRKSIDAAKARRIQEEMKGYDENSNVTERTLGPVFVKILYDLNRSNRTLSQKLFGLILASMPNRNDDPVLDENVRYVYDLTKRGGINWNFDTSRVRANEPYSLVASTIEEILRGDGTPPAVKDALAYIRNHLSPMETGGRRSSLDEIIPDIEGGLSIEPFLKSILPHEFTPDTIRSRDRLMKDFPKSITKDQLEKIFSKFNKYAYRNPLDLFMAILARIVHEVPSTEVGILRSLSALLSAMSVKKSTQHFAPQLPPDLDIVQLLDAMKDSHDVSDLPSRIDDIKDELFKNPQLMSELNAAMPKKKGELSSPRQALRHLVENIAKVRNSLPSSFVKKMEKLANDLPSDVSKKPDDGRCEQDGNDEDRSDSSQEKNNSSISESSSESRDNDSAQTTGKTPQDSQESQTTGERPQDSQETQTTSKTPQDSQESQTTGHRPQDSQETQTSSEESQESQASQTTSKESQESQESQMTSERSQESQESHTISERSQESQESQTTSKRPQDSQETQTASKESQTTSKESQESQESQESRTNSNESQESQESQETRTTSKSPQDSQETQTTSKSPQDSQETQTTSKSPQDKTNASSTVSTPNSHETNNNPSQERPEDDLSTDKPKAIVDWLLNEIPETTHASAESSSDSQESEENSTADSSPTKSIKEIVLPPMIRPNQPVSVQLPANGVPKITSIEQEDRSIPSVHLPDVSSLLKAPTNDGPSIDPTSPVFEKVLDRLKATFGRNYVSKILGSPDAVSRYPTNIALIVNVLKMAKQLPQVSRDVALSNSIERYITGLEFIGSTVLLPTIVSSRNIRKDVVYASYNPRKPQETSIHDTEPHPTDTDSIVLPLVNPKHWLQGVDPQRPFAGLFPALARDSRAERKLRPLLDLFSDGGGVAKLLGRQFDPRLYPNKGTLLVTLLRKLLSAERVKADERLSGLINAYLGAIEASSMSVNVPESAIVHSAAAAKGKWQPELASLIHALPAPINRLERAKISVIRTFLASPALVDRMDALGPYANMTRGQLLKRIIDVALSGKIPLDADTKDALIYYAKLVNLNGAGALPIAWAWMRVYVVKTEVDLGRVLDSTVDFDKLPLAGKLAYNELVTYLTANSHHLRDDKDFHFEKYRTQGEFVAGLLRHLQTDHEISERAKENIRALLPHVRLTGPGALRLLANVQTIPVGAH